MNTQTLQATINSAGVFFTIIGALLIAVDVTRQYRGHTHESIIVESDDPPDVGILHHPPKTEEYLRWERTNKRLMFWGLVAILIGGGLQIWASWINVNTS